MAVPPQTNEAFLREVDEELRRDQALHFWTRYGKLVIGAVVLGLAAFGGMLYWQHRTEQRAGEQGKTLATAFEKIGTGDQAAAQNPLAELAGSGSGAYRASAKFVQADIMLQKNDLKGAAAKFGEVVGDASIAQPFRDLALIRQTSAEYDSLKPETVVSRLRPLAEKGAPWFGSAGEMIAVAYLRMKRTDLAGKIYGQMANDTLVPESIRQRAAQMASSLGVDAGQQDGDKKAR
ncbi:MAG: hypothetical protein B7Y45_02820 [Sphingomonas sp. 28-66-16]|nr:MAG: hypothetical protein B7Y45_02820 [Sphingomonas sp. 28-66-16]